LDAVTADFEGTSSITSPVLGIPAAEVVGFVNGFKKADCSVIFYGSGIMNAGNTDAKLSALSRLVASIRKSGKEAYALPMFTETNLMGASKHTKSSGMFQKIIEKEYDTVLVVGNDPLATLPGVAAQVLDSMSIVYIGPPGGLTDKRADVSIHTSDMIVQGSESMTRLDQVEVKFKSWEGIKGQLSINEALKRVHEIVKKK
jgi:formylmethanofuran dehydrogenase subunit B